MAPGQPAEAGLEKERSAAYAAAQRVLREKHDEEFHKLLQDEYNRRSLGTAPMSRVARAKAAEKARRERLEKRLERKRRELVELEAELGNS